MTISRVSSLGACLLMTFACLACSGSKPQSNLGQTAAVDRGGQSDSIPVDDLDAFLSVTRSIMGEGDAVIYGSEKQVVDASERLVVATLADIKRGRDIGYNATVGGDGPTEVLPLYSTALVVLTLEQVIKDDIGAQSGQSMVLEIRVPDGTTSEELKAVAPIGGRLLVGAVKFAGLGGFVEMSDTTTPAETWLTLPQAFILEHPETGEPIPLAPEEFFTTSGAPLADTLGESFDGLVARVADTAADS